MACVCGCSLAGVLGLYPSEAWMFVCCGCCVLSGRGLFFGLITRPEESYRFFCNHQSDYKVFYKLMFWLAGSLTCRLPNMMWSPPARKSRRSVRIDCCMAPHSWGFYITHNDAPQSVGLLWTSGQLVAETSTWQHTTLTTDKHPCPRWDSNPRSQQASGRGPMP